MANYERINWEDYPSTNTPLDSENLNKMDVAIDAINREVQHVRGLVNNNTDDIELLDNRINAIVALPDGSTKADAELVDGRIGYDNTEYQSLGEAIREQVEDLHDNIAPKYNAGKLYEIGDLCVYGGKLYRRLVKSANVGPAPSGNTDTFWEIVSVSDIVGTHENMVADQFAIGVNYAVGDLVVYRGVLYKSNIAQSSVVEFDSSKWTLVSIEGQLSEINDRFNEYGSTSLSDYITNGTYYPGSLTIIIDGVNADISGTTTGTGFTHASLYNNQNSFPNGLAARQAIQLTQECEDSHIHFMFFEYINGTKELKVNISGNGTVQHTISENATGCIIRRSIENGHTYNNVISKGYIFTTLTKQQIETAINENTARIEEAENSYNAIAELMPTDYVNVEVATSDGLVNRWNQIAGPSGYAYIKQAVVEGEKYKVSGYYYSGNYPAYLILNGDSVLSFYNPTTTGAFNDVEVTIPQNATHIVVNGYTSNPASIAKCVMVKAGADGAKSFDSILVGVSTDYAYNDINSAIIANPNSIISVDYGTYDTEITNIATDKRIIGKDRNLCVLFGTERNYDTPPIEISGGIVKHFTVNMENDSDAEHKGYCLHSDTSNCIGKTLIIEDCKFTCTGQHTIGMGIWQNENVLYKDCEFIFKDEETPAAAFFAHNSGTSDGVAVVKFHNCIFRGSGYALKLSSYSSNCTMQFEFIDCTFESDTLTGDNMIWTDYVTGDTHDQDNLHRFKGKMPLLKTSHGNNVSIVNYTA